MRTINAALYQNGALAHFVCGGKVNAVAGFQHRLSSLDVVERPLQLIVRS